jgi:hypothetical protein
MIRLVLLACFSLSVILAFSQNEVILELGEFAERPCVADSSVTVMHPEFWIAFATVDDQLGSAKDSSVCIDWTRFQITVNGITGSTRPIFIEYIGEGKRLEANSTYSLERIQGDQFDGNNFVVAQYHVNLTYESVGITRQLLIEQSNTDFDFLHISSSCVITEKMDDPLIASYIVSVDSDELEQRYSNSGFDDFPSIGFHQFPSVLSDALEVRSTRLPNNFLPARNSNFNPSLLGHRLSGIPSPTNVDTFLVRAAFDPSGPDTVTLNVSFLNDLLIQPFIAIGFENTDDPTFTPPFELSYEYDFCLPFALVERPIAPGDGIVFRGGQPIFGNKTACIQLGESSYLEVDDQQRLWYGHNSEGMLVMKSDASIVLEPNSQMLFDGTLGLGLAADETAKISIAAGAHLEFSEASVIWHMRNLNPNGQIKVELAGGTIDLSALSEEEKKYFQISTQENVVSKGEDFLAVWHQPSMNSLAITPQGTFTGLTVNVYSLSGQLITSQSIEELEENNTRTILLPSNSPVSVKAVQFITDSGRQQTMTLMF